MWLQNNKTALESEFTENDPLQAVRLYKPQPIYIPAKIVQENDFTVLASASTLLWLISYITLTWFT